MEKSTLTNLLYCIVNLFNHGRVVTVAGQVRILDFSEHANDFLRWRA